MQVIMEFIINCFLPNNTRYISAEISYCLELYSNDIVILFARAPSKKKDPLFLIYKIFFKDHLFQWIFC